VPSCTIAPGRRTASPLHAPRDPPSPGAARRPLPARERRLFVAALETAGSVLSARSTEQTLPAGNVGATRWVAPRGRGGRAAGMMRCHRARSHQGDAPRRPYMHHRIDPHPALRAGLSLAGRGVSWLLRWEQAAAFCPLTPPTCTLPPGNVGATRWVARGVRCTRADVFGDVGPACTMAPGRRTASPLHAPQDRPSPGAARRPLPRRERRLLVASLGTGRSFLSAHSTDLHPTAGQCRGDRITPASSAGTLRESAEEAQPQYWSSAVGAVLVVGH
jgi:hypothetical protein